MERKKSSSSSVEAELEQEKEEEPFKKGAAGSPPVCCCFGDCVTLFDDITYLLFSPTYIRSQLFSDYTLKSSDAQLELASAAFR